MASPRRQAGIVDWAAQSSSVHPDFLGSTNIPSRRPMRTLIVLGVMLVSLKPQSMRLVSLKPLKQMRFRLQPLSLSMSPTMRVRVTPTATLLLCSSQALVSLRLVRLLRRLTMPSGRWFKNLMELMTDVRRVVTQRCLSLFLLILALMPAPLSSHRRSHRTMRSCFNRRRLAIVVLLQRSWKCASLSCNGLRTTNLRF